MDCVTVNSVVSTVAVWVVLSRLAVTVTPPTHSLVLRSHSVKQCMASDIIHSAIPAKQRMINIDVDQKKQKLEEEKCLDNVHPFYSCF